MRILLIGIISVFLFSSSVIAADGLISIKSPYDVKTTADRLETALTSKGMTVFARIDHAAGAQKVGKIISPTELVIFGNPKVGTPLIQCGHSVAIDLPQKTLIREDSEGQVWLSYNAPEYLAERHGITGCDEVIGKIKNALGNFAKAATMQ